MAQTKTCTACGERLTLDRFYRHKGGKYGVDSRCTACAAARLAAWRKANPEKNRAAKQRGNVGLKKREYDALNLSVCQACERPLSFDGDKPHLDHDHVTGKFRGVLCQWCNSALGFAWDDVAILAKLAAYLEKSRG